MTKQVLNGLLEIDFSHFEHPTKSCPAEISIGALGKPTRASVLIPNVLWNQLTAPLSDSCSFLRGMSINGTLDDGRRVQLEAGGRIDTRFTDDGSLFLDVDVKSLIIEHASDGVAGDGSFWIFYLVNFGFLRGDMPTPRPLPKRYQSDDSVTPGSAFDRIDATVAERTITLKDRRLSATAKPLDVEGNRVALLTYLLGDQKQKFGWWRWRTIRTAIHLARSKVRQVVGRQFHRNAGHLNNAEQDYPPGTLSFPARVDEQSDAPKALVANLCPLLSLAMSAPVNWTVCELRARDGKVLWTHHRDVRSIDVQQRQARIDQDHPQLKGVIKDYMEKCYPALMADQDRLTKAIAVYAEVQIADTTLVRAALLNMLLDRLQKEVNGGQIGPQIDPNLNERVDSADFKKKLHNLLGSLSESWTAELTGQIKGEIKRRNSTQGFGKAVRLAFESLGVQGFQNLNLGNRHIVLHDADLPLKTEEVVPYLTELDLLVFLVIGCRLGYEGQFWHPHLGYQAHCLSQLLRQPDTLTR